MIVSTSQQSEYSSFLTSPFPITLVISFVRSQAHPMPIGRHVVFQHAIGSGAPRSASSLPCQFAKCLSTFSLKSRISGAAVLIRFRHPRKSTEKTRCRKERRKIRHRLASKRHFSPICCPCASRSVSSAQTRCLSSCLEGRILALRSPNDILMNEEQSSRHHTFTP